MVEKGNLITLFTCKGYKRTSLGIEEKATIRSQPPGCEEVAPENIFAIFSPNLCTGFGWQWKTTGLRPSPTRESRPGHLSESRAYRSGQSSGLVGAVLTGSYC